MTDKTKVPELLPCPFCGGEPGYAGFGDNQFILCTGCGCSTEVYDKARAIAAWQMRPSVSCAEQVREAYERGLDDAEMAVAKVVAPISGTPYSAGPRVFCDAIRALKSVAAPYMIGLRDGDLHTMSACDCPAENF